MIPFIFGTQISEEYQKGKEEGFEIAESYLNDLVKKFYKDIKKGWLKSKATISTASSHKCNCEFCELNPK